MLLGPPQSLTKQEITVLRITSEQREVSQKQPPIFRGTAASLTEEDLGCSLGEA